METYFETCFCDLVKRMAGLAEYFDWFDYFVFVHQTYSEPISRNYHQLHQISSTILACLFCACNSGGP